MPEARTGSNWIAAAIVVGALMIAGAIMAAGTSRAGPTPFEECMRVYEMALELNRDDAVLACRSHS